MKAMTLLLVAFAAAPAAAESLAVGPDGRGAILAGGELRDAAGGDVVARGVSAAAFTGDGVLWAVSGRELGWIDETGFEGAIRLPADACRLAAGAGRLVVACPHDARHDLFVLEGDGTYRYLFTVDAIEAMSVTRAGVLVASSGAIVHYRPGDGAIVEPVAAVGRAVRAVCVDDAAPVLYVLAGDRAQALVDGRAVALADGIADLACRGGDLYLLDTSGTIRVISAPGTILAEKARTDQAQ